jgi:nitric oxide reductase large subunit
MSFGIIFVALALGGALVLGPGLVSAVVAHRKGYRPWFWILSCGLVGMLVTLLIPGLDQAATPEQRERWESRADWTGGLLSGFTFLFMGLLPTLGLVFFVGAWRAAPMMKPGAIPTPPPIVVEERVMMTIETPAETIEPQPAQKEE